MADLYGLKMTLRRLPHITNFDQVDDTRFNFFTKQINGVFCKVQENKVRYEISALTLNLENLK